MESDSLTDPVLKDLLSFHQGSFCGWSTFYRIFGLLPEECLHHWTVFSQLICSPIRVWPAIRRDLNLGLRFRGNLYEGARAWYINMAGGTEARFNLPQKVPNSYANLLFCAWYIIANSVPGYNINNTCIKKIKVMFQAKKGYKSTHLNFAVFAMYPLYILPCLLPSGFTSDFKFYDCYIITAYILPYHLYSIPTISCSCLIIPCVFPTCYHLLFLYLLLYACTHDTIFNAYILNLDLSIHVCLSLHAIWHSRHHSLGSSDSPGSSCPGFRVWSLCILPVADQSSAAVAWIISRLSEVLSF